MERTIEEFFEAHQDVFPQSDIFSLSPQIFVCNSMIIYIDINVAYFQKGVAFACVAQDWQGSLIGMASSVVGSMLLIKAKAMTSDYASNLVLTKS